MTMPRPLVNPFKKSDHPAPSPLYTTVDYTTRIKSPLSTSYIPYSSKLPLLESGKGLETAHAQAIDGPLLPCHLDNDSICSDISMAFAAAYIVLNILRVLTVVSLILACVASTLLITLQVSHFGPHFFTIVGLASRIFGCLTLITTEIGIERTARFYRKRIPIFTHGYSLAWTGVPMVLLACGLLDDISSTIYIGSTVREVSRKMSLSAGCCLGVMGSIYTLMPLVYWNSESGECRRMRRDGSTSSQEKTSPQFTSSSSASSTYSRPIWPSKFNPFRQSKPLPPVKVAEISCPMLDSPYTDPFTPEQSVYSPAAPISRWSEMTYPALKSPQPSDIYRVYGEL